MWKELILCSGIKRGKDFPNVLCRLCNKIHFANKRNTHTHSRACTRAHTNTHSHLSFSLFSPLSSLLFFFKVSTSKYKEDVIYFLPSKSDLRFNSLIKLICYQVLAITMVFIRNLIFDIV